MDKGKVLPQTKMKNEKETRLSYLKKWSDSYYNDGIKLITDEEFDRLKAEYEKEFGKAPVGAAPEKHKNLLTLKHNYTQLANTLGKVNSIKELYEWVEKTLGTNVPGNVDVYVSLKVDGNALTLEYENDILVSAVTRGQDGVGKDFTKLFKNHKLANGLCAGKLNQSCLKNYGIAFEACVLYDDFERLIKIDGADFNNPRSAVPGILADTTGELLQYLTLMPLKLQLKTFNGSIQGLEYPRHLQLDSMEKFIFHRFYNMEFRRVKIKDIEKWYNNLVNDRFKLPFMIDGIVIEIAQEHMRDHLGWSGEMPLHTIALKLPYIEKETKAIKIDWFTEGNSAIYTPVVWFDPIILNGNTYQKVSLSNYKRFKKLNLCQGDKLIFQLRNDVLGYIEKVPVDYTLNENKNVLRRILDTKTHCDFCNHKLKLTDSGSILFCDNKECELVVIGNIQNFLEKNKIKGIARNTIESLYKNDIISDIPSLFRIDYSALAELDGFGKGSAENIKKALSVFTDEKKPIKDYMILGALNIEFCSTSRVKTIMKYFTLDEIFDMLDDNTFDTKLMEIDGIGKAVTESFKNGIYEHLELIVELYETIEIVNTKIQCIAHQVDFIPLNFCITGSLNKFKREDLVEKLEAKGHKVQAKVSKTTNFLVTNTPDSGTGKNLDAAKLGIKIITEEQLYKEVGL
jgi:DNA ligase (NAD+)